MLLTKVWTVGLVVEGSLQTQSGKANPHFVLYSAVFVCVCVCAFFFSVFIFANIYWYKVVNTYNILKSHKLFFLYFIKCTLLVNV